MYIRILLLVTFILNVLNAFAFEPPVDLFSIDYEAYSKGKKPTLQEGRIIFTSQYEYYDLTIKYTVNFDKKDKTNVFVFFEKPYSADTNFREFYKDIISYYQNLSLFIFTSLSYDKDYVEKSDNFILLKGKIIVYSKIAQQNGFYGFGINLEHFDEPFIDKNIDWNVTSWWNMNRPDFKNKSEFDPDQYTYDSYFIDIATVPFIKKKGIALLPEESGTFIYQTLLQVDTSLKNDYKITISNFKNIDYLFVEYSSGFLNNKEYINAASKVITINPWGKIAKLIFWGKIKDIKDKDTKIDIELVGDK